VTDIIAGIPARLGSKRLPGKVLLELNGQPILWHVWKAAAESLGRDNVFVCSEDEEILGIARDFGAKTFKNERVARNGTERMHELSSATGAREIINIQGDDPTLNSQAITELVLEKMTEHEILTPIFKIPEDVDLYNPSLVKVVTDNEANAIYFSRSLIPHPRDDLSVEAWGHVGLYRYTTKALETYMQGGEAYAEKIEKLEQLRFLALGVKIGTIVTEFVPSPIDTPKDLDELNGRA